MRLGLLTAPFPSTPLDEVADWTAANGFESIEIACWPPSSGDARRYAGTSHIDVTKLTKAEADDIVGKMTERGLVISGLGYYPNPLNPDPAHRDMVIGHLKHVITAAELMNVGLVNTFMGGDGAKNLDDNWQTALGVWPDIVSYANDHGRKITLENCPMLFSYDEWPGGHNIATSPRMWRRILEQWGGTIGLNFDPSHLILQMIDIPRFIREFGPHILHVQARTSGSTAKGSTRTACSRWGWAGRCRASRASATSAGTTCSAPSGGPGMTATSSSSTRIAISRRRTSS
jgi:sugar phosphate isomerase/epimerase